MKKPFVFKIGGEAGFGIASAGVVFSKIAVRSGYHTFTYMEYPSIIRGGHNVVAVAFSQETVRTTYQHTTLLAALNQETIDKHLSELSAGGSILYDAEAGIKIPALPENVTALSVPFNRFARELGGTILTRDTIAVGSALGALGGDLRHLLDLLASIFSAKGKEVIEKNQAVARAGFEYVTQQYSKECRQILSQRTVKKPEIVLTGNEAISLGALAGGMQFLSVYPMTPTSNILHYLAPLQDEYAFVYKQPEDEISAINMAIGASFAGARSMVATAGGGFCLMTEAYGLAGITETPVVIIEGMRGAPATGLPTWTEQGDLRFVLHAHQGDFPRIVLAPGDAEEAFYMTRGAFNLTEKYQTPVVILVDKHLCESHQSVPEFSSRGFKIDRGRFTSRKVSNYERYALSPDGISLRAPAGSGNHVVANSDEHTPDGYSTEESEARYAQMRKRMQKVITCEQQDMEAPTLYGPKDADLTILAWGSTKGAVLEALENFPNVNFIHTTWLSPFPSEAMTALLHRSRKILNIEGNYTAQFAGLVSEKTGIPITNHLLKYDGRPFFPEEIVEAIKEHL